MDSPEESYGARYRRKRRIFWAAVLLAVLASPFVPTPNRTYGGAEKMFILIFLVVGLKALFEWLWNRKQN